MLKKLLGDIIKLHQEIQKKNEHVHEDVSSFEKEWDEWEKRPKTKWNPSKKHRYRS